MHPRLDLTIFLTPDNPGPEGIAASPDGTVWFTQTTRGNVARIDNAGVITEAKAVRGSEPFGIIDLECLPLGTMAGMEQYLQELRGYEPIQPRGGWDWRAALRKLLAPIGTLAAFLAKFGAVLLKFKFLFSMFVSAGFYVWLGGWWFGIGLILLLFVHEMGHVIEAKRQGLPVSVPVFIPFMGALITMKQMPHNAWREARLALAGPLLGSAGALVLYILGVAYDSQQLKALAFLGFLLNLFNLLPVIPLDGGRITAALHPAFWFLGFGALLALVIYQPNPVLILILLLAGSEIWRRWQVRRFPQMQEYYRVRPHQRLIVGFLYFGLAAALVVGMHATHVPHSF